MDSDSDSDSNSNSNSDINSHSTNDNNNQSSQSTIAAKEPNSLFELLAANESFTSTTGLLRNSLISTGLGLVLGPLFLYISTMCIFHLFEYIITAIFHPTAVNSTSFMLSHSRAFHIAAAGCIIEYLIELLLFPALKQYNSISLLGLLLTIIGQLIRTISMYTAGHNFTHLIATNKLHNHSLIITGIYSYCRHPSYLGWFIWAISTQLITINPICIILYSIVSWRFFNDRIRYEEYTLIQLFGQQYREYQKKVPVGVPFIKL